MNTIPLIPVRYHTAYSVYHYTDENIPLSDLDSNIRTVAEALAEALVGAAPIESPVFSGSPSLQTPPPNEDSSNLIASTSFVKAAVLGASTPNIIFTTMTPSPNGVASLGSDTKPSRGDHVHPNEGPKYSSVLVVNSNYTLTSSISGGLVVVSGSSLFSIVLPQASVIPVGCSITIRCNNLAGATIITSSGNIAVPLSSTTVFVSDGTSNYYKL